MNFKLHWLQIALTRICCVVVQSCWGMLRDNRPLNLRPFFCLWPHWKLEGSSCSHWWRCLLQRAPVRTPAGLKSVKKLFRAALTWQESGYDQPAGSQSFTVLLTDVQLALYHKAPLLWLTLGLFFAELTIPFHWKGQFGHSDLSVACIRLSWDIMHCSAVQIFHALHETVRLMPNFQWCD